MTLVLQIVGGLVVVGLIAFLVIQKKKQQAGGK